MQTWDLLRLMYYGFSELCHEFFDRFPGHYLIPLRINGSGLETIFSQLRFSTAGNLTSCNYGYALSSLTLRRFLHGHRGKYKYRKARLYVRQRRFHTAKQFQRSFSIFHFSHVLFPTFKFFVNFVLVIIVVVIFVSF